MSLSGPIALSPVPLTDPAGGRLDPVQGVTILMATRNGAVNLGAKLDSFLAQTHPPAQVIVSDDGSRDGTVAMLARFAADHPGLNLRIIKGPQRGAAANFLHLLQALRPRRPTCWN